MTDDALAELREKDRAVLACIADGKDDVQQITATTTLENHEVNYCFTKLADLGLLEVDMPEGYVERYVDGQRRVFRAPKNASLTDHGVEYLNRCEATVEDSAYRDLDRIELVEAVHELEQEVGELRQEFTLFKQQVQRTLREG